MWADLLVTVIALSLIHRLTEGGTMLVYAGMNVVAWIFTYPRVPENRGQKPRRHRANASARRISSLEVQ